MTRSQDKVLGEHDCYWRDEAHILTKERDGVYAALKAIVDQYPEKDAPASIRAAREALGVVGRECR